MTVSLVETWARRARDGDERAARALYDTHVDAVWGYCLAFSRGDRDTALDLLQDTFATAFASLEDLREPAAFAGWLRTTTRRTCLRWAERRRVERDALDRLEHEPPPAPAGADPAGIVAEVIAACPDDDLRRTAEMFYGHPPHSTNQIAEVLGLTQTAVTTRLHRFRTWAKTRMLARLTDALEDL